jgi:DNA-binding CsgD family transcriptional regulator
MKSGASGYVLKGVSAGELTGVVRSVNAGEVYVAPSLAFALLREISRPPTVDPLAELSPRERQVLERVASGLSNQEIALELGLAEKTIKHYMTNSSRSFRCAAVLKLPCWRPKRDSPVRTSGHGETVPCRRDGPTRTWRALAWSSAMTFWGTSTLWVRGDLRPTTSPDTAWSSGTRSPARTTPVTGWGPCPRARHQCRAGFLFSGSAGQRLARRCLQRLPK